MNGTGPALTDVRVSMAVSLSGVFPIVNTPFHPDGSIDFASQDRLVDHLLAQGAHGLGLFGNASEGYTLSSTERVALMRRIAARVGGPHRVVIEGCAGTSPEQGCKRAPLFPAHVTTVDPPLESAARDFDVPGPGPAAERAR